MQEVSLFWFAQQTCSEPGLGSVNSNVDLAVTGLTECGGGFSKDASMIANGSMQGGEFISSLERVLRWEL